MLLWFSAVAVVSVKSQRSVIQVGQGGQRLFKRSIPDHQGSFLGQGRKSLESLWFGVSQRQVLPREESSEQSFEQGFYGPLSAFSFAPPHPSQLFLSSAPYFSDLSQQRPPISYAID